MRNEQQAKKNIFLLCVTVGVRVGCVCGVRGGMWGVCMYRGVCVWICLWGCGLGVGVCVCGGVSVGVGGVCVCVCVWN